MLTAAAWLVVGGLMGIVLATEFVFPDAIHGFGPLVFVSPIIAAAAMAASSLLVVGNSLRLRRLDSRRSSRDLALDPSSMVTGR